MRYLLLMLALGCHSSKPAPASPVDNATPAAAAPAAPAGDVCGPPTTCQPCIEASCQWDIVNHHCTADCTSTNCLVVGAKNIGPERAHEVCAGARS
jgi:hypothetical protein